MIDVINDESSKGYVVIQAVESLFRIIDRGITDRENVKHIKEIKESLNALEGGKVVDIWIDQSDKEKVSSQYRREETIEKFMLT